MSRQGVGRGGVSGVIAGVALVASAPGFANGDCGPLGRQLEGVERLVLSVRVDKPGLARVFAYDLTEFNAGQALWLKGQVREVEAACARRDEVAAAQRLKGIQHLIQAHQNL